VSGRTRVEALVAGAQMLADGTHELGRRARQLLVASTGLSPENVDWALAESLETSPEPAELDSLCASAPPARRALVILPGNVFVAAHRAVAIALAASATVHVRASRREPHFARLLQEAAPGLFELVDELTFESGDHVFAYGADTTLAAVRARLPPGATLHAHGPGFGIALLDARHATAEAARALALDVSAFDQRGCLSPRAAFVVGDAQAARDFSASLAQALAERARAVPLGRLDDAERADVARFRDAAAYAGTLLAAGPGFVFAADTADTLLAPAGRNLSVAPVSSFDAALSSLDPALVTAIGVAGPLVDVVTRALPLARISELGRMQRPPFDGPADRRHVPGVE
jgi:hypothetical protein